MLRTAILASLVAAAAPAAAATIANNFDTENGGVTALNYAGFADLTVTGQVDLVFTPAFGITCFGGSGGCVDLDGSFGPGLLSATLPAPSGSGIYAVIFTFELSGNQRARGTSDEFYFGISHDSEPLFISPISVAWDEPFRTYGLVIDFVTLGGTWTAYVGTLSGDFIGPILDNFEFIVSARGDVPAPATLALLGLGAAALAAARRR